ncbi:nuclear transport factor 2 family protein [Bradyrhizobium sp. SZCCHNR1070]|uniref:nuclear transport factor 2 family protein n=1 Tax=Bradyrhizobium sp. SZCCHNR1070 TaxID=3057361 RepID=UPI002917132A|nr:nuclear transport factor 2 family protein [Bradyrhizobium sp. SZCCHNR1070]
MNEQTNRERVLKLLDAYSASDFDKVLSLCSEDVEHLASAPIDILPHLGPRRGRSEVRRMWETVRSRYVERRHEVLALIAEGDQVAADLRIYLRKRSNDRIVRYDVAVFYTLKDGRITRIREIMDTFDLVQQVLERDLAALAMEHLPREP